MRGRFVDANSQRLHLVENRPNQPPELLFLHGVLRNWRSYYSILPAIQSNWSIAALDFRGHGRSSRGRSYLVQSYVDDVVALLEQFDRPCAIYGHSLGAMVALAVAGQRPQKVCGLVLEDPPFSTMGQGFSQSPLLTYFRGVEACLYENPHSEIEPMFQAFSNIVVGRNRDGTPIVVRDQRDEQSRRFSAECLLEVDPGVLAPVTSQGWMHGYLLEKVVETIDCPVEMLQADPSLGGMLVDADVQVVKNQMKDRCHVQYFPNTPHSIHWAQPKAAIDVIERIVG